MLNNTDLANAVSEGIISPDQAKQLREFSRRTRANDDSPLVQEFETRDEPFRLLRGFRDIFITIGVLFLSFGASAIVLSVIKATPRALSTLDLSSSQGALPYLIGSFWLILLGVFLAEIITRRFRLPLASLVLSITIALWSASFGVSLVGQFGIFTLAPRADLRDLVAIAFSFSAFIGISLFYLRYRLPFVVLVIAAALAGFTAALANFIAPDFFKDTFRFWVGGLGFVIFLSAMWFDFKDRLRITRFSECGFWLHLLAAPMMIHAALAPSGAINPGIILIAFIFLTFIALVIDRRALLVSSLVYLSTAFYKIIETLDLDRSLQIFIPMSIIGLVVLLLGIGWSPLRRLILSLIPLPALKDRLPPVYKGSADPAAALSSTKA